MKLPSVQDFPRGAPLKYVNLRRTAKEKPVGKGLARLCASFALILFFTNSEAWSASSAPASTESTSQNSEPHDVRASEFVRQVKAVEGGSAFLIISFSDTHSDYPRLRLFLKAVEALATEFRKKNPSGEVVFVGNGDLFGVSEWTYEWGWLGVHALARLTQLGKVVINIGNHEGFDFGASLNGNRIVLNQVRYLHSKGVHVLGANQVFSREFAGLVWGHIEDVQDSPRGHVDFAAGDGPNRRTVRFLGLGLEEFESASSWDSSPQAKPRVFLKFLDAADILRQSLSQAKEEGVNSVIPFYHNDAEVAEESLIPVALPRQKGLRATVPLIIAGHDHLTVVEGHSSPNASSARKIRPEAYLVDSGSAFTFISTTLKAGPQGVVQPKRPVIWNEARQKALAQLAAKAPMTSRVSEAIAREIEKVEALHRVEVAQIEPPSEVKSDLRNGPLHLGTVMANALASWGESQLNAQTAVDAETYKKVRAVVGLFNTTSFRRETPLNRSVTQGDIVSIYPFYGDASVRMMTGSDLEKLAQAYREYRFQKYNDFSPHLSSNLRWSHDFSQIMVRDERLGQRSYRAIQPFELYVVVLDDWLTSNRMQIDEAKTVLAKNPPFALHNLRQVYSQYLPSSLERTFRAAVVSRSCAASF